MVIKNHRPFQQQGMARDITDEARHDPSRGFVGGYDSVVDKWGRSHDIANLFVSDGSQFTTGGAENQTLTIVALAIRQVEHIADEMAKGNL